MDKEELKQWEEIGHRFMARYGLIEQGWKFAINRRKRAVGLCNYRDKTIYLSEYYLESDPDKIVNTILHEIAHALTPGHGHNHVWRAKAKELGCTGERCTSGHSSTAKSNYRITCSDCGGHVGDRFRLKESLLKRYVSNCCKAKLIATQTEG